MFAEVTARASASNFGDATVWKLSSSHTQCLFSLGSSSFTLHHKPQTELASRGAQSGHLGSKAQQPARRL